MVMHKIRAASYLRRTISEPYSSRRLSTVMNQIPESKLYPNGGMHESLINDSSKMIPEADGPIYTAYTDWLGVKDLMASKLNVLLIFCPLGLIAASRWGALYTFWFNFIALIPLAAILGQSTEELALHTGDLIGGLLNATFGNAVEMILTIQSLREGLLTVVQGTLLGSILSNLLLVLGMSFLAGGLFHHIQTFNRQGASCSTSMLMLACLAFILPTTLRDAHPEDTGTVLEVSRFTAVLVGFTYFLYLFFQLYTHLNLFKQEQREDAASLMAESVDGVAVEDVVGDDWPTMSWPTCVLLLLTSTVLVALQSEALVSSIEGVCASGRLSKSFIGIILLPIVGNAAEHATAVTVAIKNKPDLVMGVAVGSSTQIAMFMVPFAVIAGWVMDVPMTLAFDNIAVVVLVISILITIGVVQDGESNWLEGAMLMVAYAIIAGVYWFNADE
ncbi:calcium/proton exchanger [Gregarina niphandrodes]|uniref:Calcium/proton exchanger n=1 Tax=Gregarina niphandrodes TaxID=110365 RepID=A0A023B128_GRENI|nr:calcium/proton exchanger [Gregarina niphandrodes]EZG46461.1 calcium/proton exchanger [Gregarina niphandrodes]|eukprot:XP_011132301.1 calcium/proton exchanger [Gregarina niphandrodes]